VAVNLNPGIEAPLLYGRVNDLQAGKELLTQLIIEIIDIIVNIGDKICPGRLRAVLPRRLPKGQKTVLDIWLG